MMNYIELFISVKRTQIDFCSNFDCRWPGVGIDVGRVDRAQARCRYVAFVHGSRVRSKQCDQIEQFLHFGQLFQAFGNNYFSQISHILRQFL